MKLSNYVKMEERLIKKRFAFFPVQLGSFAEGHPYFAKNDIYTYRIWLEYYYEEYYYWEGAFIYKQVVKRWQ